jgi:hypothetical protein
MREPRTSAQSDFVGCGWAVFFVGITGRRNYQSSGPVGNTDQ